MFELPWERSAEGVTHLEPQQVFVFGSNVQGHHGLGAAREAFEGRTRTNWRYSQEVTRAKALPVGDPGRVGRWAVYGVGEGYSEGREGRSYAIPTVTFDRGQRLARSPGQVWGAMTRFWAYAAAHPELEFLITPVGSGFAQIPETVLNEFWLELLQAEPLSNVRFVRMG